MGLIDKFFGKPRRIGREESSQKACSGQFMPKPKVPIEDKFLINFKENGGKFLYCTDFDEVEANFREILRENDWTEAYCKDKKLREAFARLGIGFSDDLCASFALISCEFLIADTGAILISSNQIGEKKLRDLPVNLVIFASMGQMVDTVSDGLHNINLRKQKIPSNITTIKNFSTNEHQHSHFMNYGSISKNLYLILLEDF